MSVIYSFIFFCFSKLVPQNSQDKAMKMGHWYAPTENKIRFRTKDSSEITPVVLQKLPKHINLGILKAILIILFMCNQITLMQNCR